jgi:hypothetical protein
MLKLSWSWDLDGLIIVGSTLPRLERAGFNTKRKRGRDILNMHKVHLLG